MRITTWLGKHNARNKYHDGESMFKICSSIVKESDGVAYQVIKAISANIWCILHDEVTSKLLQHGTIDCQYLSA